VFYLFVCLILFGFFALLFHYLHHQPELLLSLNLCNCSVLESLNLCQNAGFITSELLKHLYLLLIWQRYSCFVACQYGCGCLKIKFSNSLYLSQYHTLQQSCVHASIEYSHHNFIKIWNCNYIEFDHMLQIKLNCNGKLVVLYCFFEILQNESTNLQCNYGKDTLR
jgi:hypothetical protein